MHGYHGHFRRIELTTADVQRVPLAAAPLRQVVGGVGLGTWLLLRESVGDYDPLSPAAPLVIAYAPLVGTALNTSAKCALVAKSPLTGRLNDAMLSSGFALAGKAAGDDALVLHGACAEWSTLFVEPGGCRIERTPQLLGLSAAEAEAGIHATCGDDWAVAAIGVAGEREVPYALVSHDGRHAGRGGLGAVMGSKRLKAIAVRGDVATAVADRPRLAAIAARLREAGNGPGTEKYRTTGTLGNLPVFNRLGLLPTRNFQACRDSSVAGLTAEALHSAGRLHRGTCRDCTIGCERRVTLPGGPDVRIEYESAFALGTLLGIGDVDTVLEVARWCDHYGLDTISTGGTIAFAMECTERGLIPDNELRFGDGRAVVAAVHGIARREGSGARLALGSRALAQQVGGCSGDFAPHVKGLELPGYHPAALQTLALGLAVGSRGADHNKSAAYDLDLSGRVDRLPLDADRIAEMVDLEDQAALLDSLILCKFVRRALDDVFQDSAEMLAALTGESIQAADLAQAAARVHDLRKWFNQRQGWSAAEDVLPERFFRPSREAAVNGPPVIDKAAFLNARAAYYRRRGWDADGRLAACPLP